MALGITIIDGFGGRRYRGKGVGGGGEGVGRGGRGGSRPPAWESVPECEHYSILVLLVRWFPVPRGSIPLLCQLVFQKCYLLLRL